MARPRHKAELIDLSKKEIDCLMEFIPSFSEEEKDSDFPKGTMNSNIRDTWKNHHHWDLPKIRWRDRQLQKLNGHDY